MLSLLHPVSRRIVENKNEIQKIARFAVLNPQRKTAGIGLNGRQRCALSIAA